MVDVSVEVNNQRKRLRVPLGAKTQKVVKAIVQELGLPEKAPDGSPAEYVVDHIPQSNPEQRTRLHGNTTLEEAGVQEDDTLHATTYARAGAIPRERHVAKLRLDYEEMKGLQQRDQRVNFEAEGDPPFKYRLTFHCRGLAPGEEGPVWRDSHECEVVLGTDYPVEPPQITWQTPLFHPNVKDSAVCLGGVTERPFPSFGGMVYICEMLLDMVQCRNYELHGVLNPEAGQWYAENQQFLVEHGGVRYQTAQEAVRSQRTPEPDDLEVEFRDVATGPRGPRA